MSKIILPQPAILSVIDPQQYGGIPRSSATLALINMVHQWSKATDGTGDAVRVVLLDYRKAFDLIDHQILAQKVFQLHLPLSVKKWVINFLMDREQRVKLSRDCFSEWHGVPQGTKLGPWLFILMINNLKPCATDYWKYIDDTTTSEVVKRHSHSTIQESVNYIQQWSMDNRLQLNSTKCKELRIHFGRDELDFSNIRINGSNLEMINHIKILGLTISNDLKWNQHVNNIVKKANKRIYFIIQLKRAKIPPSEILLFYCTCVKARISSPRTKLLAARCECMHLIKINGLAL